MLSKSPRRHGWFNPQGRSKWTALVICLALLIFAVVFTIARPRSASQSISTSPGNAVEFYGVTRGTNHINPRLSLARKLYLQSPLELRPILAPVMKLFNDFAIQTHNSLNAPMDRLDTVIPGYSLWFSGREGSVSNQPITIRLVNAAGEVYGRAYRIELVPGRFLRLLLPVSEGELLSSINVYTMKAKGLTMPHSPMILQPAEIYEEDLVSVGSFTAEVRH